MDKIQINIPTPALTKLKLLSRRWDKSTSEIIRMAIEQLIAQVPDELQGISKSAKGFQSFDLGEILVGADEMREILIERSKK